jgi:hypothetical protein
MRSPLGTIIMNRLLFILSICGIITCISINILVVSGIFVPEGIGSLFLLIVGMFIVFAPAVLNLRKLNKQNPNEKQKGIHESQKRTKAIMRSIWQPVPTGLKVLVVLTVIYGFANFFSMMFLLGNEQAAIENGKYIMESKGKFLREISQKEYFLNKQYQASLFTGHIAIFYSVAMILHYPRKNVA